MKTFARSLLLACLLSSAVSQAQLPPVPAPDENPPTEAKRVLGKMLFWDEQLSTDNSVACGSCHRPASGGIDPRPTRNPGFDPGTLDDVFGSPGIASLDELARRTTHPVFGEAVQITARASVAHFNALWATALFWDGRAGPELVDPLTGQTVIRDAAALENQVLMALANGAEMSESPRDWSVLIERLTQAAPLALARDLPRDIHDALKAAQDYPALFAKAFGDPDITPVRIALAIATYERSLIADETPWDRYQAGDADAMSEREIEGWHQFEQLRCTACHVPPLFTDNGFYNIGLRRASLDRGRQTVTGNADHAGDFKVPSLRGAGLRPRFMHTGEFDTLSGAIRAYIDSQPLAERDEIPGVGVYSFSFDARTQENLALFIGNALTDPRLRNETFPFDRPKLRSEMDPEASPEPPVPERFSAIRDGTAVVLDWSVPETDSAAAADYILERADGLTRFLTSTGFTDSTAAQGQRVQYQLRSRNAAGQVSEPVSAVAPP